MNGWYMFTIERIIGVRKTSKVLRYSKEQEAFRTHVTII